MTALAAKLSAPGKTAPSCERARIHGKTALPKTRASTAHVENMALTLPNRPTGCVRITMPRSTGAAKEVRPLSGSSRNHAVPLDTKARSAKWSFARDPRFSQLAWCALARAFKIHKSICTRNPKVVQNGYLEIGLYFAHLLSAAAAYLLARHRPASLTQASLLHLRTPAT